MAPETNGAISLGVNGLPLSQGLPTGGAPIEAGERFVGGTSVEAPAAFTAGEPVGGPASLFNIGGAPIAVLGGVFQAGLPIGGPVSQIFRGGSAPTPPTLFINTLSPAGPIGAFFLGTSGAPIGVETFGGGALPIGAPPDVQQEEAILQPRTALVVGETAIVGGPGRGAEAIGGQSI